MKKLLLSIALIFSILSLNAQIKAVIKDKNKIPQNECSKMLFFEADTTGNNPKYVYTWDFGDFSSKIEGIKTNHFYNTLGNGTKSYTVTLTVKDTTKGTTIMSKIDTYGVTVKELPDASMSVSGYDKGTYPVFATCNKTTPPKLTLSYTSFLSINTFYEVDWDNTTPKYSSTTKPSGIMSSYPNEGYYYLKTQVTGANGCINRDTITFYYGKSPATLGITFKQGIGGVAFCSPVTLSANIQNQKSDSKGTLYTVNYGDGTNNLFVNPNLPDSITHTYITSTCKLGGPLRITIKSTNGCGSIDYDDQQSAKLKFSSKPKPYIIEPLGKKYCKNIPITFSSGFTEGYDVDNFCLQKLSQSQWQITPNTGVTVTGTLTTDKLTATFSQAGTYKLKYTGTGACGSGDTTLTINILELPKAAFGASKTKACLGEVISFTNQSQFQTLNTWSLIPVSTTNYQFVNNTNKNALNPDIQFNASGLYTVNLKAENSCGFETAKIDINVLDKPYFEFTFSQSDCEAIKITDLTTFIKNIKGSVDKIILESPNLGKIEIPYGGKFGTLTFPLSETFKITLIGECGSLTRTGDINISPKATLTIKDKTKTIICSDKLPLKLEGTPKASNWYVDGVLKASNKLFFDFNETLANGVNEKDFKIKFSGSKCDISDSMTVKVYRKAAFNFSLSLKDCKPISIDLNNYVSQKSGKIDSIIWQTKLLGEIQKVDNLTFTKSDDITVTVFSPCGNITQTGVITIEDKEVLKIKDKSIKTVCSDKLPLTLEGISIGANDWYVNGVKKATSKSYQFNPTISGDEQEFTIIYSGGVCDISDSMTVKVYRKAAFNFSLSLKDCKPISIDLNNYVSQKSGKIDSIVWQTKLLGKIQKVDNLTFTKSDDVTVTVFSPCGNITQTGSITIEDKEVLKIKDKSTKTICSDKLPLTLEGISIGANDWYVNGVKKATSKSYQFNPTISGDEQEFTIIYSGGVCNISDTMKIKVYRKATFNFSLSLKDCKPISVDLNNYITAKSGKIDSIIWKTKLLGEIQKVDNLIFTKSDDITVTVFSPCENITQSGVITIEDKEILKIKDKSTKTICSDKLPLTLEGVSISANDWYVNGVKKATSKSYQFNPTISGDEQEFTIIYSGGVCDIPDTMKIKIYQKPTFKFNLNKQFCSDKTLDLNTFITEKTGKITNIVWKSAKQGILSNINALLFTQSDTITATLFSPCDTIVQKGFIQIAKKFQTKIFNITQKKDTLCEQKLPFVLKTNIQNPNWTINGKVYAKDSVSIDKSFLNGTWTTLNISCVGDTCTLKEDIVLVLQQQPIFNLGHQKDTCFVMNYNPPSGVDTRLRYKLNSKIVANFPIILAASDTIYRISASYSDDCNNVVLKDSFFVKKPQIAKIASPAKDTILCSDGSSSITLKGNLLSASWKLNGIVAQNNSDKYVFKPSITKNEEDFVITYGDEECTVSSTIKIKVYKKAAFDFKLNKESCKKQTLNLNDFVLTKTGKIDSTIFQTKKLGKLQSIDNVSFAKSDTVFVSVFSPCGIIKDTGFVTINTQLNIKIDVAKKIDTLCEQKMPFVLKSNINAPKWTINGKVYNQNTVSIDKNFINSEWTTLDVLCEGDTCFINDNIKIVLRKEQFFSLPNQQDTCLAFAYTPANYDARLTYKINGKIENKFPITLPVSLNPYIINASFTDICHNILLSDTFYVSEPRSAKITLPLKDTILCESAKSMPLKVQNKGGKWLSPTVQLVGNDYIFTPNGQQKYSLIYVTGSGSCEDRDTLNVSFEDVPTLVFDDVSKCTYSAKFPLLATPKNGIFTSVDCPQCVDNQGFFDVKKLNTNTSATVTYTYTTSAGCVYSKDAKISIEQPKADFIYEKTCETDILKVDSTGAKGAYFEWFINNKKTNIEDTKQLKAGNYTLKMIAHTATCLDSISKNIYIITKPVLTKFKIDKIGDCAPVGVAFTATQPTNIQQKDVKYLYDFGRKPDDTASVFNPKNILYEVKQGGKESFKVSLTAYNECFSITWDTVFTLKAKPKAEIALDSSSIGCSPYKAIITNRTLGEDLSSFSLNFGNGQSTMEAKSYYTTTYFTGDSTKIFKVFFMAKNTCGEDFDTLEIVVKSAKIKAFYDLKNYKPCPNQAIQFSDSSTPKPDKLKWDFGDGTFSNEPNPTHIFAEANRQYKVVLYAYSPICEGYDSILHIVTTKDAPKTKMSLPLYVCQNQPAFGIKNETQGAFKFLWEISNGYKDSTHLNPTPIFGVSNQKVKITLTAYSVEGCGSSTTESLLIREKPSPDFELANNPTCQPAQVVLKNSSTNATGYTWIVNQKEISKLKNPTLVLDKAGLYDIMLIANYENTCFDTLTKENIIELFDCQVFIPNIFSPNNQGENNIFTIYGNESVEKIEKMEIYDRWGNLVFEGTDLKPNSEGWDGSYESRAARNSVYVYKIKVRFNDQSIQEYKGDIQILR